MARRLLVFAFLGLAPAQAHELPAGNGPMAILSTFAATGVEMADAAERATEPESSAMPCMVFTADPNIGSPCRHLRDGERRGGAGPEIAEFYRTEPSNFVGISGVGPIFAMCGWPGPCKPLGLDIDHQRHAMTIIATASQGVKIAEGGLSVDFRSMPDQAANIWIPNTAYFAGEFVGAGIWIYGPAPSNCTSGTVAPSGTGNRIVDGSCIWAYAARGNDNAKVGMYNSMHAGNPDHSGHAKSPATWNFAVGMHIYEGAQPRLGGLNVGMELDLDNYDRDCAPGVRGGCNIFGLWLGGISKPGAAGTIGLHGQAKPAGLELYHWGIALQPGFAKDRGIQEATGAKIGLYQVGADTQLHGIWQTGMHSAASIYQDSTAPYGLRMFGTYSAAAIDLSAHKGTATTAIVVKGTDLVRWSAEGNYSVAKLPQCNAATTNALTVVTDARTPAYNAPLEGGGAERILAFCNGSQWRAH
jgi:hypothetical protein